jgi:hypothetical protein
MNRTTHKLLAVVIVLQGLTLLGQWTGSSAVQTAKAEIPDPANRQMQMIEGIKTTNDKLDKLIGILESGDLQVKVVMPDEEKKDARAKR